MVRVYTPHKTAAHHMENAAVAESVDTPIELPIIDFAHLQGDENTRRSAMAELDQGFQTYGFVYLANHTIPQEMVDEAFFWVCYDGVISHASSIFNMGTRLEDTLRFLMTSSCWLGVEIIAPR